MCDTFTEDDNQKFNLSGVFEIVKYCGEIEKNIHKNHW